MLLKKRSVFSFWLLSYILILFVPILFGTAVYVRAEQTVEFEINHSNRIMLEQTQQALDGGLYEIKRFINQIEINKRFKQLLNYNSNESDNYFNDNTIQAFDDFKYYRVVTSYINDYFIYIKAINKVVNGSVMLEPDVFYKGKIENGNGTMSEDRWEKLINGYYSGKYIALDANRLSENDSEKGVAYSVTLPMNRTDAKGTLVIFLNYKKMQNVIQSIQTANNGMGLILDQDNELLFSTTNLKNLPQEISYEKLKNEKDTFSMTINGQKSVVSHINSKEAGMKYISVIPYAVFWKKVEAIRLLTIVCSILCIALGILGSYWLAKKNYSPVDKLLASIANKTRKTSGKGFNEYKFIQEAISETMNENQDLSERLKQQKQVLKSVFLAKLIKGKIDDQKLIADTLPLYNMEFASEYFAVVVFYIKDFDGLFQKQYSDKTSEEKWSLVRFVLTNVFEELVSQENIGYMAEVGEMNVCLVNFRNKENGRQQLLKVVNEAYEFIKSNFKIDFTIALSDIHRTYSGIPEAYSEALNTLEYQIAVENGEITAYNDIKGHEGKYNYTIEEENQLINCIKAGDAAKGRIILNAIFDSNFAEGRLSNTLLKCTMHDLASTMLKAMMEVSYICGEKFIDELHIEDRLLKCEKVKELRTQMLDILEKVCNHIHNNKKSKRDQLVTDIIEYIEGNYSNVNLNMAIISERFDLTPQYLTRLFKEHMSDGIYEYISKIRMEKAKLLLKNKDMNIKDIAEKVGYFSSNIFIRAFKKYEGITPGMYRDIE